MYKFNKLVIFCLLFLFLTYLNGEENRKIAYLVSDIKIPFWEIMSKGIKTKAEELNYKIDIYSADNIKKKELENTFKAISSKVDALIISPINSSTAVTILDFAKKAKIPVIISDIGADTGDYVSFISSDNENGAYKIGKVLTKRMYELGIENGSVGIVGVPQKRANGKARTKGFLRALEEDGIKSAGIYQQVNFSYKETYEFSKRLINENKNIKAIWLQGSDRYKGALDAIKESGKKILLICFDAEPIFLDLIPKGVLVGSAMQQPYLMGQKAVELMDKYLDGKMVEKEIKLSILPISKDNIKQELPIIKRNVLGIE